MTLHAVAIWILAGLLAGWVTRVAMRSHRDFGLLGDLTTGCLGALAGGALMRRLHVLAPDDLVGHVLIAVIGAAALLAAVRVLWHLGAAAGVVPPAGTSPGTGNFDTLLHGTTDFERRLFSKFLRRRHASRDINQAFDAQLTVGERVADRVAAFGGSWTFIGIFFAALIAWMALNEDMLKPFDPYPFILLNLVLSCLAAIQAPIIMMSQNRQAAKDRLDARNEFEVNLRAEMEIMALHEKLDGMRSTQLQELKQMLQDQVQRLESLEQDLGTRRTASPGAAPSGTAAAGDTAGSTESPTGEH